jgi:hypothetical protein
MKCKLEMQDPSWVVMSSDCGIPTLPAYTRGLTERVETRGNSALGLVTILTEHGKSGFLV